MSMPEPQHRRIMPCHDCPWRVDSKRAVWSVEHFHDLRLGLLQPDLNGMVCQSQSDDSSTCQGFLEFRKAQKMQVHLTRVRSEFGIFNESSPLFPSFEAMADANSAGLFDWTSQLAPGDLVAYLKYGIPKEILEVARVQNGVIEACTEHSVYRFNNLGYEMQTVIDSRILPATPAALQRLRDQLPKQPL
jgi:Family of unknown function (DUF6283)